MALRFSLDRVASPAKARDGAVVIEQPQTKIPKVEQLQRPMPPRRRRAPTTGDVVVCLYKYCDDASAVWMDVQEPGLPLWQIQMAHEARDSMVFNLLDNFNEFLAQHEDASIPKTAVELQRHALIKLVSTSADGPDEVGTFVRWRPAFYVAGSETALNNFCYLLDAFLIWLTKDRPTYDDVCLHPHGDVDIDATWDHLEYPNYTLEERAKSVPLGVFEAYPPQGKRLVLITIQVESESVLSFVFHGNTWPFRQAFDVAGIPGLRDAEVYFRVLKSIDASSEEDKQRVLHVLGDGVLKNVVARVTIEGRAPAGTAVHTFLRLLRERQHLFFA